MADDEPNGGANGLVEQVKRLIDRHGSADRALRTLLRENRDYRERHRTDEVTIAELKQKVPAEGTMVLAGDDAKAWAAFKSIGVKVDDIKTLQTENTTLKAANEQHAAEKVNGEAAGILGVKPNILSDLLGQRGMVVEIKQSEITKEDGTKETKRIPHVLKKGDPKAAPIALEEYIKSDLKDYAPALAASTQESGSSGIQFPVQGATGKAPSGNEMAAAAKARMNAQFQSPSELAKAATTTKS